MEKLDLITIKLKELYTYIEMSRSLARQSKIVDCFFKLQGTLTKFLELHKILQEHFSVPESVIENDSNIQKIDTKSTDGSK